MLDLILKRLHWSIPEEAAELLARLVGAMIRVCACFQLVRGFNISRGNGRREYGYGIRDQGSMARDVEQSITSNQSALVPITRP